MEHFIYQDGKRLRLGFTTGTAAALAVQGALRLLFRQSADVLRLLTPRGIPVEVVPKEAVRLSEKEAICSVEKDGGDDQDVTDGLLIAAKVTLSADGKDRITITGGKGIGTVTKPGLDQPVGASAINTVPRQMIEAVVTELTETVGYDGCVHIEISAPEGEAAAKKTFNERLGIQGGISIIGTTGIVEPMSRRAFSDAMRLEIRQKAAEGADRLILTPGNYGTDFLKKQGYDRFHLPIVTCSNFIGDALDEAVADGCRAVLLVGHIGKLGKLAGGIFHTHSRVADGRMEILSAHAGLCGADAEMVKKLMDASTTEAALELLDESGMRQKVTESLLAKVEQHLSEYVYGQCEVGAVLFSNVYGQLGKTKTAELLLKEWEGR